MNSKRLLSLVAVLGLAMSAGSFARADDAKMTLSGVLIDQHCGEKMAKKDDPQAAAAGHDKACCQKCGKDGMAIMSDGKLTKLDDKSGEKAMDYLKDDDHTTSVKIEATKNDDGTLAVSSIEKADEKK